MVLIVIVLAILAVPFFLASNTVDLANEAIAFDWKIFHAGVDISDIGASYSNRVYTPPWSILFLVPLTTLPFKLSWSLMLYFTTLMIVASVPRSRSNNLWIAGTFLLLLSYPTLRNFADVNLEAYVILGILLSSYAYHKKQPLLLGLAVLIAAIKPQSVFLVMFVLGIYMLQTFSKSDIVKFAILVGSVFGITMLLWGQAWFDSFQALPGGISIKAGLTELGLPSPMIAATQIAIIIASLAMAFRGNKELSRLKVGLLVVGSVMATPYANNLSTVSILAIAVVAYFMKRPLWGFIIFVIYNLPYLSLAGIPIANNPLFWMFALSLLWVLLAWEIYLEEIRPSNVEGDNLMYSNTN